MQTNPRDITQTNEMISLIDDAIADSLGPDWTSFDAAHHVFQWLQDAGFQIVSAAFAEREARLVGALGIVGKVLPSAAGLDDAPDSKIIACYMSMGEMRAIKEAHATLKDRTHG